MDYNEEKFRQYVADRLPQPNRIININKVSNEMYVIHYTKKGGDTSSLLSTDEQLKGFHAKYLANKRNNTINSLLDE